MKRYQIEIYRGSSGSTRFHWTTVKTMLVPDRFMGIPEDVIRTLHRFKRNNPQFKYRLIEVFFWTEGGKQPFQDSELVE